MKYFIDFEFLEGDVPYQIKGFNIPKWFIKPNNTIQPISVGICSSDDREYYAVSKDFNLKEAWNRYDLVKDGFRDCGMTLIYKRVYWIRENVLKPIYNELATFHINYTNYGVHPHFGHVCADSRFLTFTYKNLKWLINKYGKTNKQISEEIKDFVYSKEDVLYNHEDCKTNHIGEVRSNIQFYGYYCDYDWVVFCWLFGKMIDLPKGFPMFAFDIQQQIEEYKINKEQLLKEVPQISCHNALQDAIWNKNAYNWIKNKINNGYKRSI